jgi:hypothetical protein
VEIFNLDVVFDILLHANTFQNKAFYSFIALVLVTIESSRQITSQYIPPSCGSPNLNDVPSFLLHST